MGVTSSAPAQVRCGWALGTGAHPAVDAQLGTLARRGDGPARTEALALLLGEADAVAAIGQHLGLRVERVSLRREGEVVVRMRGATASLSVTLIPRRWTLRVASGAPALAAHFAQLAPSWVGVRLDDGTELRGPRTRKPPPRWTATLTRAWRERYGVMQ
jgi:hypothetical protein